MSTLREYFLGKEDSKTKKKKYEEELKKQSQVRENVSKFFNDNGIMANVGSFSTNRINNLPVQQQQETIKNGFKVNQDSLIANVEQENKFRNLKKSDEYKKLEQELTEQSNKAGYAKYDYDKSLVDEDKIGWFDKTLGTVLGGAKGVFDYSGGLIKNENGDLQYLPNKSQMKQNKVLDSYETGIGKFLGQAGYEVGKIGGTALLNEALPGVGTTAYFGKMFSESTNDAISKGYDSSSATLYGITNTALEFLTGKLLGSATKGLTGGKSNSYETLLNDTFNKLLKKPKVANLLANAGSEATEEFIQEYMDNITKLAILDKSKNISDYADIFTNPDILADAIYSAGIGGVTGGTLGTISGKTNVSEEFKKQLEETKKNTADINTISQIDKILNNMDDNQNNAELKTVNDLVLEEQENKINNINSNNVNIPSMNDFTENNINIPTKDLNLIESAKKYNLKHNDESIQSINKMMNDRGIKARFDDSMFTDNQTNAMYIPVMDNNGQISSREIVFNPNADTNTLLQEVSIHEMYHDIFAGNSGNELSELIQSFNMNNEEFNLARQSLANTYAEKFPNLNQNSEEFQNMIDEEVVADVLGRKLGNQEYINSLIYEKPNIAKRIYDFIVDKLNKLTGYKNEKLFWTDIKNKFDKAYRSEFNNSKNNASERYMITGIKGMKNLVKSNLDNQWVIDSYNKANKLAKQNKTNEEIRKKTLWFKDNEGKWKFEISDNEAKFLNKLEKDKKYKLGDIFDHEVLLEMYPEIKNMKIKFKNIRKYNNEVVGGQYIPLTNTIEINNLMLDSKNADLLIKKTMLHEIQHYIQNIEKFNRGYGGKKVEEYYKNLGEIEAKDTENRITMDEVQRYSISPESAKEMPIHPDIQKIIDNPDSKTAKKMLQNKDIANLVNKIYNEIGDNNAQNNINIQKDNSKISKTQNLLDRLGRRKQLNIDEELDEELDNSSFSYKGSHQIENAKKITDLNLNDIQEKVTDANGGLSKQDYSDLNKLKKILNSPNEPVKIYRAAPVNELNDRDWVTTDRTYAQNVANSNGGKVYSFEVNANQLYYPDNVKELPSLHRLSSFQYVDNKNLTSDLGIRYSVSATTKDNKGRTLSKQQQEYFKDSKVRDDDGNLLTLYHGTPNAGFSIFNKGSYFSPNKNYANNYQDENASILKQNKGTTNKQTYEVYLNIKNPFELKNSEARDIYINEFIKGGNSGYFDPYTSYTDYVRQFDQNDGFEWLEAEELRDWIQENHPEYDGLVVQEVPDNENPEAVNLAYIPFNSNQIKNVDNTKPTTNDDIRYSSKDITWQEYLDKNISREGSGTKLKDIKLPVKKQNKPQPKKSNLTQEETTELKMLEDIPFELDEKDSKRLEYLKNKEKGYKVKYPELKKSVAFEDIKKDYQKYKDMSDFNKELLNTAKSFVPDYRNTGRRTKEQWLSVANFIGSNIKTDSSNELTKYAIQSWFSAKPNTKETLNRQGQKYVKFSIEDWINEVYKGAGVGNLVKENNLMPIKNSINTSNSNQVSSNNQINNDEKQSLNIPVKSNKKVLNPNEISQLTEESANTTPILPNIEVSSGKGNSKYAHNIEEKTDMLTKESKKQILSDDDVIYYKEVSNKESLEKAYNRLNKGGESETQNWLRKESTSADSTDVAEGWILLKQYQDKIEKETDLAKKDELNRSMVQIAKKMREMGTKAGQTVQAYNILNRLTPEGMVYYAQSELSEAYNKMIKNKTKNWIDSHKEDFELSPQETQFIMKTMEEVKNMEDGYNKRVKLAEIQTMMTNKLPPEKGASMKAWMRISMLFNPKTQVRNIMGNAVITPVNMYSDLFASFVDRQIAKKTGTRTTGTFTSKDYLKGFKQGAFQSYNDFKKGINTRNIDGNRFEIGEGKSFNDKTKIGKALNKVDNILSFMLDAGDRTFYEASFTNSINNQLILNKTDKVTQDMIDIATNEALSRTWQDNNNYTDFVLNIRRGLNKINVKGYGLGDVLIPFAKTPANLTKAIVDYSPLGLVSSINKGINFKKSLTNGQYTPKMQHEFVQSLGKATAGTMLYIAGLALAKAGISSGDSDDDKDVANFLKNTLGVSSYSIKIGDKSFTYDWAQPVAAPLAMTANLTKKQKAGASLQENITTTLDTGLNILFQQSFLDSLSDVLSKNGEIGTKLEEQLLDLPSRAIPTLSKQLADMIDGTQRTSFEYNKPLETAVNKMKSKIPFVSKSLSASVDTMGREIQKYGGKNNIFNVFLNPANVNTENISTSAEEIYKVYMETGDFTIMPRVAPYYINQKGDKVIMSSQQREEYQKVSGKIIEDNIKKIIKDTDYQNMNVEDKADIIKKIVDFSYNKAKEEVLDIPISNTYNKINKYINDGGNVSDYYLNKEEIDYSYNYPENYKTISQITSYDNYTAYQKEINQLKDDYDNTNQRKNAIINYVNNLELSIPQKAMLIRMNYSSFNSYDNDIIEYINNQELSIEDKTDILTKLGFKIRNGRVYAK